MGVFTTMQQRDHGHDIASAAAGDGIAFQRIIGLYHEDMRRVCTYVTCDDALAEEAVRRHAGGTRALCS